MSHCCYRGGVPIKIIAVTACRTGIAHTFMAAEELEKTARSMGHQIKVETQGRVGIENELSGADIEQADAIIFAADIAVKKMRRFARRNILRFPVRDAILNPAAIFAKIE